MITNSYISYEHALFEDFLARSQNEQPIEILRQHCHSDSVAVVPEGFEERSVGILEKCATLGIKFGRVILGRYRVNETENALYRSRLEAAATATSLAPWTVINIDTGGTWITNVAQSYRLPILLDITGLSSRALFGALDALDSSNLDVKIAYSEAAEYWPKQNDWKTLKSLENNHKTIADLVDEMPWLFGHEHSVEILQAHEGYDSATGKRLLVAFLPFKRARLAAVVTNHDYEEFLFLAGAPRLAENQWRLEVLKDINADIVKAWPLVDLSTFGYRGTLKSLFSEIVDSDRLKNNNIHLALLGSKLQDVGCWALSKMIPSVAFLASVPKQYYSQAFSDGVGAQWFFPLTHPVPRS